MTGSRSVRPPRLPERLLRWVLPIGVDGSVVVGDLREEHAAVVRRRGRARASLWYWGQALALIFSYGRPGRGWWERRVGDVRLAFRGIKREPGFAAAVVCTLALGIGAGAAIYSVVDAVLLRPLPFEEPDRLVRVWATNEETGARFVDGLYQDVDAFREGVSAFQDVQGFSLAPRVFMGPTGDGMENVLVARTTGGFFQLLGVTPTLGRSYSAADLDGGDEGVLLSEGFWRRRFAGDPATIGGLVHLGSRGYRVLGVVPEGLSYPEDVQVWRLLTPEEMQDDDREVHLLARLGSEVTLDRAGVEAGALAVRLAESSPESHAGFGAWVQPLRAMVVRDVRTALFALLGAVGLVLVIACVNTASLLLARSARRSHEVAIRAALGAGRARIVSLHLTESLVLAALGGALGLLVGRWALDAVLAASPRFPRLDAVTMDLRVVAVMAIVTTLAGVLFGVIPALHAARGAGGRTVQSGGRGSTLGGRRLGLQSGLVATEVGLSTVLAVMAVLLFQTFRTAMDHDRGLEYESLVTVLVDPLHPRVAGDETRAFFDDVGREAAAVPGVTSVGMSSHPLFEQRGLRLPIQVLGEEELPLSDRPRATMRIVTPELFPTAGIPVLEGRVFSEDGGSDDEVELVVNRRFAESYLAGDGGTLGRRVDFESNGGRVVGVVGNVTPALGEPAQPMVYVPFSRLTVPGMWVTARVSGDPAEAVPHLRRRIGSLARDIPLDRVDVMAQTVRSSVAPQRFNMILVLLFAGLALCLAAVGVYGVTALSVATRRAEIGVRRALGASDPRVVADVGRRVAVLAGSGVVLGLLGAVLGGRLLGSLFTGVELADPWVLAGVAGVLGLVSALAALLPVVRAIRIDPTEAFRGD